MITKEIKYPDGTIKKFTGKNMSDIVKWNKHEKIGMSLLEYIKYSDVAKIYRIIKTALYEIKNIIVYRFTPSQYRIQKVSNFLETRMHIGGPYYQKPIKVELLDNEINLESEDFYGKIYKG